MPDTVHEKELKQICDKRYRERKKLDDPNYLAHCAELQREQYQDWERQANKVQDI